MKKNKNQLNGIGEKIVFGIVITSLGAASLFMLNETFAQSSEQTEPTLEQIMSAVEQNDSAIKTAEAVTIKTPPEPLIYRFEPTVITARPVANSVAPIVKKAPASIVLKESKVTGKVPVVALSTEEKETDFITRSEMQLEKGELKQAFRSLRRHVFVNDPTSIVLYQIANLGRQVGEYAIAEQALLDAGALDPENSEIQVELARVHIDTKNYRAARMAVRQAIRIDDENAMAWNVAGRIAMMQYHWQRAEGAFRRAIAISPTNPMVYNNLGLLYVRMSEGEQAVDALEASVELFGDDTPYFVYNNLGLAYEKIDALEDARDAFEQAITVNSRYTRARLNLERAVISIAELDKKKSESPEASKVATVSPSPESEAEVAAGASN